MGRVTREGYGYGMTENDAKDNFVKDLNRMYGEDSYQGGGNDIREWLKSKCIEKPKQGKVGKQVTTKELRNENQTLINGFVITNFDERRKMFHHLDHNPVIEIRELAPTLTEAKKIAKKLALQNNDSFYIQPKRLWKDKFNKISESENILIVSPKGATQDKPGKWYFQVECSH